MLDDGTLRVTLPRWGSKREALAFVERSARVDREAAAQARSRGRPWCIPTNRRCASAPRRSCRRELLALAAAHGITVTRVSIRNQRSRWGACSSRGSITLNWRLILVPPFVREYVMIHELMHRRELNHSKRFWKHVAAACPQHQEARAWLLSEGQRLFTGQEMC